MLDAIAEVRKLMFEISSLNHAGIAALCDFSESKMVRVMNRTTPLGAEDEKTLSKTCARIRLLAQVMKPVPIDFKRVREIRALFAGIEAGTISAFVVDLEAGPEAESKQG